MRPLRIGLAQLNPTVGDLDGNFEKMVAALERARDQAVDVLAFPEMVITGYPPEDLLLKPSFIERAIQRTRDLLPHTRGMTVAVGTVDRGVDLYDAAAVLHDGQWGGTYRKHYLPNYGVFDENRYFAAGAQNAVFARGRALIGVSICEDIWFPGGPVEEQVIRGGAEVIINLSASPYHAGKAQARRRMLCTRAADNLVVVCYANLVGGQDEIVFDGASLIVNEQGQVLAEGRMFEEDLVVADLDLDDVFNARLHDPRLRKGRVLDGGEAMPRVELPMTGVTAAAEAASAQVAGGGASAAPGRPALEQRPAPPPRDLVPEIYEALVLGTRDYMRKNGFETAVLGLSGGVDSALTACLAADAVGAQHLVGVSMPSGYTSSASREDAESLARALGIRFYSIPVRDVFEACLRALQPAFSGRPEDITEENLQARIRGNYLMALSNKFGWLVLTTGNKSEASVGYATLYGDMAGGFAVLKDVYKTMVYRLARHRNERGAAIPERTLTRPPTAELKPDQTDQDTLPPYEVLDPILKLYVEEDRSAAEIVEMGYDEATVRRVVRMVDVAEYKRRQSPPGIKISPRAFGKDRRLPITNRWRG
ncbi:MAG: NAD+ synthase [Candidatus Eisenbacteria bacterium]|nr:NAD+ synthase [Candidatus Eisenbacteria bacterium]